MQADTIVVTGATGTVGRHVIDELITRGAPVRAASRHPGNNGNGAQSVQFSFTDPSSWPETFTDARALFLIRPPQVVNVRRDLLPAVASARQAGVRRVVFLSVLGAQRNPLLPHRSVERWLQASGMASTALRAGNFMQNLLTVHAADIRERSELVIPAGDAAMSYVDARDVAAVAAACLLDRAPARGAWDLTGPEAITHTEIAAELSEILGRTIRYTRPSLPRYWLHARRTGMAPGIVAATSVLYTLARIGIGSRVTTDIAAVLGRPASDIARFARDHRASWTPC